MSHRMRHRVLNSSGRFVSVPGVLAGDEVRNSIFGGLINNNLPRSQKRVAWCQFGPYRTT
jgi:hypothetical protein